MSTAMQSQQHGTPEVRGEFVDFDGERYYAIRNVDRLPPFFISVVSALDHWLFVSSTGGLTAGRVSPDTSLFPYITVDKIHECGLTTGPRTMLRVEVPGGSRNWEPFNREQDGRYETTRNLYKNVLGNKICFEEINHDLGLVFRYTWASSGEFGFIRDCVLGNTGSEPRTVEILDGLQNLLPAGTPRFTQTNSSNLVDAYKWTELDPDTGLALYTLYSGITDRAEPCESLKANVVFCLGLDSPTLLLSSEQLDAFRRGGSVTTETRKRGIRGAFFVSQRLELAPRAARSWRLVADIEKTQAEVVALRSRLANAEAVRDEIETSVAAGSDALARIMASSDALQRTSEENVSVHHYANVLFNVLRGGYFPGQYEISMRDFRRTIREFNLPVYRRNESFLGALPDRIGFADLLERVRSEDDPQLLRLCQEYLPITFGRRHGDPSRPWNQFAIRLRDRRGEPLLHYEGNWRDIFQNWEALALSYPEFVENVIAKFVNASTMDGHNPYRITKEGIDWEVEDPDDPWSYIGYWGDHQIIYLQKLLELSRSFHPARLTRLLHEPIFAYANVPYRIRPFAALLANPKNTVDYDEALAARIDELVGSVGADGKLVTGADGEVYRVTLLEKLLVPLLGKIGNLVVDGGIWMNTQRPEWNDANNALVGQGLSMVTLYYLRRYVRFLEELIRPETRPVELSAEVAQWLAASAAALRRFRPTLARGDIAPAERLALLRELGEAASSFREKVYANAGMSGTGTVTPGDITSLLDDLLAAVDHSIEGNRREDGLYHAYNLLERGGDGIEVDTLYPMLEGQVAALSAGAIGAEEAATVLESLYESKIYRADQRSFMLYPDRALPAFLEKNRIPAAALEEIPLLKRLLREGDDSIVVRDADGCHRFSAGFRNVGDLDAALDELEASGAGDVAGARDALRRLFEEVFDHQAFTGRSGTMFGFEGLGCIYWHMVAKLLLAAQENYFAALDAGADAAVLQRLGTLYYRVRAGLGFNKTPAEYGAFPTDPYSHTPGHNGARQPGMTGQVKEEILTRFGELGARVGDGRIRFEPRLLRRREFGDTPGRFRFLDVGGTWREIPLPAHTLAFTWCQVPVIYRLEDGAEPAATVVHADGNERRHAPPVLSAEDSASLFRRAGHIREINVSLSPDSLFNDSP